MEGDLSLLSIPDLLQMICLGRFNRDIHLFDGSILIGVITISAGRIEQCIGLGSRGEAAFYTTSCGRVLVSTLGRFGIIAIVMLGYNGYTNAAEQAATRVITRWENFYGDCQVLKDWSSKSYVAWRNSLGITYVPSCSECYDQFFPAPNGGAITVCSEKFANPADAYNQMVSEVGNLISQRATSCAALRGGYYSQPFSTPLLLPDAPNSPDRSMVCPY